MGKQKAQPIQHSTQAICNTTEHRKCQSVINTKEAIHVYNWDNNGDVPKTCNDFTIKEKKRDSKLHITGGNVWQRSVYLNLLQEKKIQDC